VHVACSPELTLRRPFSVAGVPSAGEIEILFEVRGPGTASLARRDGGDIVSVMGPLGNAFTADPSRLPVLVAGGIGAAGLRLLAQSIADGGEDAVVLVGARDAGRLLDGPFPGTSDGGSIRILTATDDGSAGFAGTVCGLLEATLDATGREVRLFACGPDAMIREVARIAGERDVPCEVSLEERMACGVGACRGCVVPTVDGYRTVCADGPVFDAARLVFEEEPGV